MLMLIAVATYGIYGAVALEPTYGMRAEVTIKATPDRVFAEINDIKRWAQWSGWDKLKADAGFTYSYSENTVGEGAWWLSESSSDKVKYTITASEENRQVSFGSDLKDGTATSAGAMMIEQEGENVKLVWQDIGEFHGWGYRYVAWLLPLGVEPMMQSGLDNLKRHLESTTVTSH